MISRLTIIVLALLTYCNQLAVATPTYLRRHQNNNVGSKTNTVATSYRTIDLHRYLTDTEYIPWIHDSAIPSSKCLKALVTSADNKGHIKTEDYLILTNELSNGYYTSNDIDTYDTLPNINKVVYMMLVCQCVPGIDNDSSSSMSTCCPIDEDVSYLDVSNMNIENTNMMSDEYNQYLSDICSMTLRAIGSNVLLVNTETRTVPPVAAPPVIDNEEEGGDSLESVVNEVEEEDEADFASIDEIMEEVANTRFDPLVVSDSDTKDDESTSSSTGSESEEGGDNDGVDSTTASIDDDSAEGKVNIGAIIGTIAFLAAVIALVYFSQRGENKKVEVETGNEVSTEDVNGDIGSDNKEDGVVQPPVSPARGTTGSYIGNVQV